MRSPVVPLLLAVAVPTTALAQDTSAKDHEVVVTGLRLSETERALRDCIARKCSADQEIAATLHHAENLFVAGDYETARSVLRQGRDRNRRFAAAYPTQVATLLRAGSRVAVHLGDNDEFRLGAIDSLGALKAGLPADDWRLLGGRLEIADAFAHLGRYQAAEDYYRDIAGDARRRHLPAIEGFARLRIVALYENYAQGDPGTFAGAVKLAAKELIGRDDPAIRPFARAAELILARQQARFGDLRPIDQLIARYGDELRTTRPVLVYTPSLTFLDEILPRAEGGNSLRGLSQAVTGQWIDVTFFVQPNGQVSGVDLLRASPGLRRQDWSQLVMSGIKRRRYLPLKLDPGDPGLRRVERYTLTASISNGTAEVAQTENFRPKGRSRRVSDTPHIEYLDLSIDPALPAATGEKADGQSI